MPPVLLYDLPLSHYCVKVKRILAHKGIPYEAEYAAYHDRQELLSISGQDYVPYMLWADEGVTWDQIPDFLEAKKPEPTLYPDGTRHLARMLESWAHEVVEERVWRVVAPDARATFADPREAWVFEEIQRRTRGDLDAYAQRKPEFLRDLVALLRPLDDRLGESPYVLGERPSLADFALYGAIHPLPYTRNEIPADLKRVRAWFERVGAIGSK